MTEASATTATAVYVCPACRAAIDRDVDPPICRGCERPYATTVGIPDFRLEYLDPYSSREEDARAARELAAQSQDLDLERLLREHWRQAGKPPKFVERFVKGDMVAPERAEADVAAVEQALGRALTPNDRVLEVGAGTAALGLAAARRGSHVLASDVSMRWLVLARKRIEEAGAEIELVCCAAEALPFRDEAFDLVIAGDVVEHVADQRRFVGECTRVLAPGGLFFLATPNRYSVGLEPHVRLWGVGFLPRPVARKYVEVVRRAPYDHVRLLSSIALRRLLESEGLRVTIDPPEVSPASQRLYGGVELRLVRIYNRLRQVDAVRLGLRAIGPFFHVFAVKEPGR